MMYSPELWVAFLRVVVGAWFLKAVWTKLTLAFAWGVVPYLDVSARFINFHPKRVAEFAAGNPVDGYREFLQQIVLPHAELFARLQAYGEAIVGVTLLVGICVGIGSLVGLFLAVNYGLATQWMSFGQQGFHLLLIASMIIFLGARAGRAWSLNGLILRAAPSIQRRWIGAIIAAIAIVMAGMLPRHAGADELRVFVTNEKSNNVTVISAADHQVLATIPVGQRPRGVTASRDGRYVYVANSNSNNVSVIDTRALKVIDTFPAGIDPEGMTIDRRGILYAVNENDSAVTIIDVHEKRIIKTLKVGLEPETAVLSPDQRWVAVSNESSNEIHFIETATLAVAGSVAVPANPRGMRFGEDSRELYVASEQGHTVSVLDVARRELIKSVATGGERPVDIALCAQSGRMFVSHGRSEDVRIFETATLKLLATVAVGPRAWWVALTPDGRFLYVTVGRANEVVVIDTQSYAVAARIPAGGLPWGVAIVVAR
jgi:PQQ-dependent catabolism-associated beta-propeller protein